MINSILAKIFGTKHARDVKRMQPLISEINAYEPEVQGLSDEQLRAQTEVLRKRLQEGESLDDLMVQAFATVREAAVRTLGMRHYDAQLMGGLVLHQGQIAEMKTGEGKTLMSTLPVYLNALAGRGVHVVTVNDYLAQRDADWMAPVFKALGISVGVIQTDMPSDVRQQAYAADITYGTNNEFGFDYLRDNMKFEFVQMAQRGHAFAIVDEVDSILIDEARTPLIISGPSEESTDRYYHVDRIIPRMERGEEHEDENGNKYTTGDFLVDEKASTVSLTDEGVARAEKLLQISNLYDLENMELQHGINQGLRAHQLYKKDVHYLLRDGADGQPEVVIVDEFTGRMMPGRRWSDGLHQAVEAKEGVKIRSESQTFATITFQNYFRMYDKLAGMTGTAETEETEFGEIYQLEVAVIPTNRPMVRKDHPDVVFRTAPEKWNEVVEEIRDCHERGQPTLVGTISIESSEMLSKRLKRARVPHVVLNAKYHQREAAIVAQAGRKGSVTIATNMAGRGTDIVLGGNAEGMARAEADPDTEPDAFAESMDRYRSVCAQEREEVLAAGGLHILGTERHESRRIDNQLRGRSGRQGDPGSSRFFLSLDDDLMRIFGHTERVQSLMGRLGMEDGEAIEHGMVTKAIERAQSQVEGRNFDVRKHLLKYDDVMNKQREAIYELRHEILEGKDSTAYTLRLGKEIIGDSIERHCPDEADPRDWGLRDLSLEMRATFGVEPRSPESDIPDLESLGIEELDTHLVTAMEARYLGKEKRLGEKNMRSLERNIMLRVVDNAWKEHLLGLDHLKEGINLRAVGQRDPLNEYKRESFELFHQMKTEMEDKIVTDIFHFEPPSEEEYARQRRAIEDIRQRFQLSAPAKTADAARGPLQVQRAVKKVGRNQPCPCGSGKKYKKCHGAGSA